MTVDVWEHAYYLKYQNKRAAWVEAWWNLVSWEDVLMRYEDNVGLMNTTNSGKNHGSLRKVGNEGLKEGMKKIGENQLS